MDIKEREIGVRNAIAFLRIYGDEIAKLGYIAYNENIQLLCDLLSDSVSMIVNKQINIENPHD